MPDRGICFAFGWWRIIFSDFWNNSRGICRPAARRRHHDGMKKLFAVLALALTLSVLAVQADPPVPACPFVCDNPPAY